VPCKHQVVGSNPTLGSNLVQNQMITFSKTFEVKSSKRIQSVDITSEIQKIISESGIKDGIITIFIPHTTCGVFINENWDPTVQEDIHSFLSKNIPQNGNYAHTEGNADAHIKTAIIGNSVSIPINDGKIPWGTWQGIFLAEFDGPRKRKVIVKIIGVK
jgi:secondary thiamine-phosphate synthase enzyme